MNPSASESTVTEISTHSSTRPNLLKTAELKDLNVRSTRKGLLQLTVHLLVLVVSGYLWGTHVGQNWAIALPALIIYGFGLAAMFAPLHECSHRTAFANNRLNDIVCWFAGLLSFYNSSFFRRYHKWHHRYTRIPGKDPELTDPPLNTFQDYLWVLSGLPWWVGKIKTHTLVALGRVENFPFITEDARSEVIRSTRLQLAVYGVAILGSAIAHQPWFLIYWLFPLMVGQPILRFILLAEHTGCSGVNDPLSNTRTTLTLAPLRILMWNMPFHTEHHLYPSIPFYRLPSAHQQLKSHFAHVDPGYIKVNREIISSLSPTA